MTELDIIFHVSQGHSVVTVIQVQNCISVTKINKISLNKTSNCGFESDLRGDDRSDTPGAKGGLLTAERCETNTTAL